MTPHAISSQKNPSVSFYYRNPNAGLYSPQNMPKIPKPIYMGNEKQIKEKKREKPVFKREFRKSMPAREEVDNKMQYFNSNGDIHDIDPDIATDLERFSSWDWSSTTNYCSSFKINCWLMSPIDLYFKI